MDGAFEVGSGAWYVLLLLAGLAVGVAIAVAQKIFRE